MPTLYVVDPLLKHQGGHYLGQHFALWHLCQRAGFEMVIYCHVDFNESFAPTGVKVKKTFQDYSSLSVVGHYCVTLGVSNRYCFEDLSNIDISKFGNRDILFLTSATADRVVAYGQWLRTVLKKFQGFVGLYATVSAEIDDTVGRKLRRDEISISDDSFFMLDDVTITNDLKCSMYRFMFESIPDEFAAKVKVFYEEPFPSRKFMELCRNSDLEFTYLHSMYPGGTSHSGRKKVNHEPVTISYMGSGGIGDNNKGHHLLTGIVEKINDSAFSGDFQVHLGNAAIDGVDQVLLAAKEQLKCFTNVNVIMGLLNPKEYCNLIEGADIVILPYGHRYKHIMSGIFDDCLFLGIPCVVPQQSKMMLWLERHNIDSASFKCWDADSISDAVTMVIHNYDYYRQQFQLAQEICRTRWTKRNPFSVFGIPLD